MIDLDLLYTLASYYMEWSRHWDCEFPTAPEDSSYSTLTAPDGSETRYSWDTDAEEIATQYLMDNWADWLQENIVLPASYEHMEYPGRTE